MCLLPRNWTGKSGGICGLVYWTCNNLEEKIWKSFHWETEIKKYDICTFWEISDTTPQYLSGLFPLRFLFWSGNQIEKFQTCWKSNFKKKLSTLNEAFPGKKVHINFSSQRFVGDTELWGLLEQFPFHSSLWSTSIFSQLRSHMLTRLIPALKWNGAIQKIRYIASSPHKRYCCRTSSVQDLLSSAFLISRNMSSRI